MVAGEHSNLCDCGIEGCWHYQGHTVCSRAWSLTPDYPPTERSVSALNEAVRLALTESIEAQLIGRPDLRDIVIPKSPFAAKRIVRDNGIWISTLKARQCIRCKHGHSGSR